MIIEGDKVYLLNKWTLPKPLELILIHLEEQLRNNLKLTHFFILIHTPSANTLTEIELQWPFTGIMFGEE